MAAKRKPSSPAPHPWAFRAVFRKNAFGWQSAPAITRVRQAVAEIRKVAKASPVVAAEGAVLFLERVAPALERVDSSSGSIGSAVDNAIDALVPLIAEATVDEATREAWLERLYEAHAADQVPYIELLAEHWGALCASPQVASRWADRLLEITTMSLGPDPALRGFFHGTSMCLSALYRAERYDELIAITTGERMLWTYQEWGARAWLAQGKKREALRFAESCRRPRSGDLAIDRFCEEVLLSSGLADEAYARYGLRTAFEGTYLARFRSVTKRYPHKDPRQVLADLAATTPGEQGKWFAAAKDAGLLDEAIALAKRSPCDPKTLARAARDLAVEQPAFALEAGLLSLEWMARGFGYELTSADVRMAYDAAMSVAERGGVADEVRAKVRGIVADAVPGALLGSVLGRV